MTRWVPVCRSTHSYQCEHFGSPSDPPELRTSAKVRELRDSLEMDPARAGLATERFGTTYFRREFFPRCSCERRPTRFQAHYLVPGTTVLRQRGDPATIFHPDCFGDLVISLKLCEDWASQLERCEREFETGRAMPMYAARQCGVSEITSEATFPCFENTRLISMFHKEMWQSKSGDVSHHVACFRIMCESGSPRSDAHSKATPRLKSRLILASVDAEPVPGLEAHASLCCVSESERRRTRAGRRENDDDRGSESTYVSTSDSKGKSTRTLKRIDNRNSNSITRNSWGRRLAPSEESTLVSSPIKDGDSEPRYTRITEVSFLEFYHAGCRLSTEPPRV